MEEIVETLEQAKKVFNQLRDRLLFLIDDKAKGIYMILDEEGIDMYTTKTYVSPSHIEHDWKPNLDMEIIYIRCAYDRVMCTDGDDMEIFDIRCEALPAGAK